jgi:hypothetical protein
LAVTTPARAAAEKNTKNAAAKTHKVRTSGYQDIRGQEIRKSGYQEKRKHRATWCYPMFSGGEKNNSFRPSYRLQIPRHFSSKHAKFILTIET